MQDNRWPPAIIALRQCLMVFLGPQHIPKPCWKHLEAISRYFKVCRIFVQYADCPHTRKAFWSVENLNVSQRVPSPMMSCVRMSLLYSSFKCSIMFDRLFSFLFRSYIIYICPILSNYPSTYPGDTDTQEASPIAFVCLSFVPDLSLNFRNSTQG